MSNSNNAGKAYKPNQNDKDKVVEIANAMPYYLKDAYFDRAEIQNYRTGSYFDGLSEKQILDRMVEEAYKLGLPKELENVFRRNSDIFREWQSQKSRHTSAKSSEEAMDFKQENQTVDPPDDSHEVRVAPYIHPLRLEHVGERRKDGCIVASLDIEASSIMVVDPIPEVLASYRQALIIQQSQENGGSEELTVKNSEYLLLGFYRNVKVYNSIIPGKARKVEFDIISSVLPSPVHLGPSSEKDILSAMNLLGLIPDKRNAPENLTIVINAYIQSGKAEILTGFDTPGFYWDPDNERITVIGYQMRSPSAEELRNALTALDRIVRLFPQIGWARVSSVVKWGLSAPFHYCMKQRHIYPREILEYGVSGTFKTAALTISHGIYGLWDGTSNHGFFISGTAANTEARMGVALEKGTFPVIIDEADPVYLLDGRENHANVRVIAMLKYALQSTESRFTYDKGTSIALAAIGMTANRKFPAEAEALLNRIDVYETSEREVIRASLTEKAEFQALQNKLYPQLEPIGQWAANKITENPGLLTPDYITLGEDLLSEMYREAGLELPEWVVLRTQVTTIEDDKVDRVEQIRSFLVKSNLEAFSRNIGRTGILTDSGRGGEYPQYDSMTNVTAEERIGHSIRNNLIPWQIYKNTTGIEHVVLTTAFAREISRIVGESYNLQSIGELLGFEYKVAWINSKSSRTIAVKLDYYLRFLLPGFEDTKPPEPEEIRKELRELKQLPKEPEPTENNKGKPETKASENEGPQSDPEPEIRPPMNPALKLLIDCTYNSSKKYKTVTELWKSSTDPNLTQELIFQKLEKLVKEGKVIKKGSAYGSVDVLEGKP